MTHILVLEDDLELAFELRGKLEAHAYQVTWCKHPSAALHTLQDFDIDLVITDMYIVDDNRALIDGGTNLIGHMRMTGFRRDHKDLSDIPIIAISAAPGRVGNNYILDSALSMGATHSMEKPLDYQKLLHLISDILTKQTA